MKIPYLDLPEQYKSFSGEILEELSSICKSGLFAQGPPVVEFEREFANYCGVAHAVAVNSGTSALHLALRCLNVGAGDEVITVPMTFVSTAWAISYVGATPVFVDIDPVRRTMDPSLLEAAITSRTKAILPVHLYGQPAQMDDILSIAYRYGIPVVEDGAQAHGARYRGRLVGQLGTAACFSFYPGKNLGAYGEGGALVTDDPEIAKRAASLRNHAQSTRYIHTEVGFNYRMDSFQAAVLSIKLARLEKWNEARRLLAARYTERLKNSRYGLPTTFKDSESVWHCYVIESEERDQLRERLAKAGVEVAVHYPVPLHLQPVYASLKYRSGDFPVSERLSQTCLSLPIYPELTGSAVEYLLDLLTE